MTQGAGSKGEGQDRERLRGEIKWKAREKAGADRKKQEEVKEQKNREQEERNMKMREEEQQIEELPCKAEQAERAWEQVCTDDTLWTPPTLPRSRSEDLCGGHGVAV